MTRKLLHTALVLSLFLPGCRLENLSADQLDLITNSVSSTFKAARPISDEEEYYVGRAVAAKILTSYRLVNNRKLTDYVNLVGQAVAIHSEKPFTFGGYHFAILDSGEINAFACPGGIIFITRGMLDAVSNEDELAAVLAHEVGHINHRDGIGAISQARWTEALTTIGSQAAKTYGSKDVAKLVGLFEGSIDDVFKTLVVNGYGRSQEHAADLASLNYLAATGYDPHALKTFLDRLVARSGGSQGGIMKTHPATRDRVDNVAANMPEQKSDAAHFSERSRRFASILGK
ncbi:M48 family metalloprotease [Geotalea sp. SG265]|uniref:M48 family metalloprotease n=1 Tax=Geotalea sp. SG265 TaxID=2922867 RepID=UPI001FAFBBF1|nr:M48 family metalloprotease [Geotalea sp. SG265]